MNKIIKCYLFIIKSDIIKKIIHCNSHWDVYICIFPKFIQKFISKYIINILLKYFFNNNKSSSILILFCIKN